MSSHTTTDHETIRTWVEGKGGKPAAVDRTHVDEHDVGLIRLMFPKSAQSEHSHLVEITWEEFFEKFEESSLALIYSEDTLFNKLIGRDTAEHREHGEHSSRHHPAPAKHEPSKAQQPASEPAGDAADLKSREYRDADGTVHHHTTTYAAQHAAKK